MLTCILQSLVSIPNYISDSFGGREPVKKKEKKIYIYIYWSGVPFPSPGDLPDPGIEPRSPALQADTLTSEPPGKPIYIYIDRYRYR